MPRTPKKTILDDMTPEDLALFRRLYESVPIAVDAMPYTRYANWFHAEYRAISGKARTSREIHQILIAMRKDERDLLPKKGRGHARSRPITIAQQKLLGRLYVQEGVPSDSLAYTDAFERIYAGFQAGIGSDMTREELYRRIYNLRRRKGRLPTLGLRPGRSDSKLS